MNKIWICDSLTNLQKVDVTLALVEKTAIVISGKNMVLEMVCMNNRDIEPYIWDRLLNNSICRTYWCRGEELNEWNYIAHVACLIKLIKEYKPNIILFTSSRLNKIIAAQIQTEFEIGLTADCNDFFINDEFEFIQIRPTYEGKKYAHILTNSTIRLANILCQKSIPTSQLKINTKNTKMKFIHIIPESFNELPFRKVLRDEQIVKNPSPKVILSGGLGLKNKENLNKLRYLANYFKTGFGVTRPLFEMGWASKNELVGMSGSNIAPNLLITFGISGSIQHLAGVQANKIISINTDINAPIHKFCDHIILEDVDAILTQFIKLT